MARQRWEPVLAPLPAMTHAGFAALVAMFLLMSGSDLTTSYAAMRANAAALSPTTRNVVFVLALFGFGSKAGIVPLHETVPQARVVKLGSGVDLDILEAGDIDFTWPKQL